MLASRCGFLPFHSVLSQIFLHHCYYYGYFQHVATVMGLIFRLMDKKGKRIRRKVFKRELLGDYRVYSHQLAQDMRVREWEMATQREREKLELKRSKAVEWETCEIKSSVCVLFHWHDNDGNRVHQLICRRLCHFDDTSTAACLTNISTKLQTEKHENIKAKQEEITHKWNAR